MIQASRGARLVTQHPHLMANYGRLPINIVRGEGCWLYDESGNAYLDLVAGIAVCALGHAHPRITRAIAEQAATLVHVSNLVHHEPAGTLADRLAELSGFDAVFFCNSGAEANEAAIKLARKVRVPQGRAGAQRHPGRERLVPRPHARRARRDRQPEVPGRLRAAAGRLRVTCRSTTSPRSTRRSTSAPRASWSSRCRARAASCRRRASISRRRGGCATSAARC